MFQIGDKAREGNAAVWTAWYWKNSYGSSNWKIVEWNGTEGLEIAKFFLFNIDGYCSLFLEN